MGWATSTTITNYLPTLIAASKLALEKAGPCRQLVQTYEMEQGTLKIPVDDTVTVSTMTEGSALATQQDLTPTSNTLTSVKYGAEVPITDEALRRAANGNVDMIEKAGRTIGRALGKKIDTLIIALFDGFSSGIGAGSANTMSMSYLSQGLGTLRDAAADGPFSCVLSGLAMQYLMADIKSTYATISKDPSMVIGGREWFEGSVAGVNLYTSPNFTVASSAVKGAIFNKDAIALGIENDITIETERIRGVGYAVHGQMNVAVVETQDGCGVELHMKSA